TSQFYGVDKANGVDRYIGGMQDNSCYLSPNDPLAKDKWKFVFGGDGFDVIWNYEDENKVMLTSQFNNIAITHDGIETLYQTGWSANVDNGRTKAPFFTKLAQSKQYPDLVFAFGENGVWRTDNFGVSWSKIAMPDDFDGTSSLNEIKISLIDPSIVWTGSSLSSSGTMNVSTDFGKSFKRVSTSDDARSSLSGFATHPKDKNTAYALFSSYGNAKIMKTSDLGNNWKDISGFSNSSDGKSTNGFPDVAVYDLLVMPYDTNIIWAGTEIGIFESKDKGATWNYANNGMPPVSVYDLLVVNDEVVIGTHGRGVWSVTLPELAGYEPPVTAVPLSLLASYYFDNPKQFAKVSIEYKSNYSSVKVYLNDVLKKEFSDVSKGSSEELMLEIVTGENTIKVVSVSNGNTFKSLASVLGLPLKSAVSSYSTDFNIKITDDFFGSGFYVKLENGFDSKALQSSHPYLENSTKLLYLRNPILVSAANPDFRYDDVAIIEVGETGTSYPDPEFWDYVTVEASVDGSNWIQLEDPYDASYNANWKSIYSSESSPTKNNYVSHSINLTDFFSNDDVILIRFKLYSDEAAVSWGWIIDNLSIQSNGLSNDEYNFNKAEMSVFPNPINSNSKIELPEELKLENLNFKLYDISGKLIKSGTFDARNENVNLPFNVSEIEGGNYVFSVSSDKYLAKKKLLKK
ncbi:MAG: T9SS type A sorting domain-containing protein, partial [Flavobacteriales bacterium]|nr:T9SS type A sorting domain-containing protein [Flavobacteriales bacterium]